MIPAGSNENAPRSFSVKNWGERSEKSGLLATQAHQFNYRLAGQGRFSRSWTWLFSRYRLVVSFEYSIVIA